MVERKLYKTKICLLYQRGRCSRQHCNFAHGSTELRRSSFNNEWIVLEYSGGRESRDLRERLDRIDRMRSPLPKSPVRGDPKARHSSHGDSHRSPGKRINRNHQKRNRLDDHTDNSGRILDGTEDIINEQLREMHSEIKNLEGDKRKLEMYLEDKVNEADTLTVKTHELEVQLSEEKEEAKRFTTKIKKFIKAHNRHLRLQDELKRSHAQLQKLGEQLDLNAAGPDIEEDVRINTINDDIIGVSDDGQLNLSPQRKRSRVLPEVQDASNQGNPFVGRTEIVSERVQNSSRQSRSHNQLSNGKKSGTDNEYNERGLLTHEGKSRRDDIASADKYKVSETDITLPSTGIAAHALDEDVDVGAKFQVTEAGTDVSKKIRRLPFLPPPPPLIPPNVYVQYKADDESVDIDGIDEDMVEVDVV